jgi:3-hydroxybutyryl-CoA dehydrogenase
MHHSSIRRIGIIGGGAMGWSIALDFALAGCSVTLFNTRAESSARARDNLGRALELMRTAHLVSDEAAAAAPARIAYTTDLAEAAATQDFLVESVPEDLSLKQQVFRELDRLARPDAMLTSNTTALSISAIARVCARPERVLSVHYYLPAHLIPLVDVLPAESTDPAVVETVCQFLEELGKWPARFERDAPGSVGPRLQAAMMSEAFKIVQEGVATPEMVDRVITMGIGRRFAITGIFDRLDLAGLDVAASMSRSRGQPMPPELAQHVERGELGVKTGQGFYSWDDDAAAALEERMARHLIELLKQDRARGLLRTPRSSAS